MSTFEETFAKFMEETDGRTFNLDQVARFFWNARQPEVDEWKRRYRECSNSVLVGDPRNSQEGPPHHRIKEIVEAAAAAKAEHDKEAASDPFAPPRAKEEAPPLCRCGYAKGDLVHDIVVVATVHGKLHEYKPRKEECDWSDACHAHGHPMYAEAQCVKRRGHKGRHRNLDGERW